MLVSFGRTPANKKGVLYTMKNLTLVLMLAVSLAACKTNKQANKMASDAQASGYAAGQSDAETKAVKAAAPGPDTTVRPPAAKSGCPGWNSAAPSSKT